MKREDLLGRISVDPNICFGKPCIKGHRIWVSLILDFLASGWTVQDVLKNYPGLKEAEVLACIAFGAEMARERYVDIALETKEVRDMDWRQRIVVDPDILVGKPVVKGTRLAVEFIVDLLSQGWPQEEILHSYPHLTREDIQACLSYASDMLHAERVYPVKA